MLTTPVDGAAETFTEGASTSKAWNLHVCHVKLDLHCDLLALSRDHDRVGNQLTKHLLNFRDPVINHSWVLLCSDFTLMGVRAKKQCKFRQAQF